MADEKKTVTVESLEWHTYDGKEYPIGATYEIDEQFADSVVFQGKAKRQGAPPVPRKVTAVDEDTTVEPMGTKDMPPLDNK
jgi:hypothetical protein